MAYVGQQPVVGRYILLDQISGGFNGTATGFTMTAGGQGVIPGLAQNVLLSLGGVIQQPGVDYLVSGSGLTFTTAPVSGTTFFATVLGDAQAVGTPSDGTVIPASIASSGTFVFPNVTVSGVTTIASGSAAAPSLSISGDANTGLYSAGADQLSIATSGTARLSIDGSGNINILQENAGPTYPEQRLKWSNDSTTANGFYISQGTDRNGKIWHEQGLDIQFATNNTERLRITSAGNVGINTTSPGARLQVNEASDVAAFNLSGYNFLKYNSTNVLHYGGFDSGWQQLAFHTNSNERARIDSSGRLLVGTSTARSNLYANTVAYTPKVQIESNTNTWGNGLSLINYSGSGYGPTLALGLSFTNTQGANALVQAGEICGKFQFLANDGTNFYPIAEIQGYTDGGTSTGDVPGRLVFSTTVDGASSPTERMRIRNGGDTGIFCDANSDVLYLSATAAAGTSRYLLIGKHSATGTITSGTVSLLVFTNGNIQNTNNSYAGISDIKLKENVVDAASQWADIKALQVRKYNFKEGQTHTQIGLIAQEVELISPGLVSESPDRDAEGNDLGTVTKSVNYSVLYMKAVKALQEAMERIETLEAKVTALEGA